MWMLICDWGHSPTRSSCWARPGECQPEHLAGMGVRSCDGWAGLLWSWGLRLTCWPLSLGQAGRPAPGGPPQHWCGLSQTGQASSRGSHPGDAWFSENTDWPGPTFVSVKGSCQHLVYPIFFSLIFLSLPLSPFPAPFFKQIVCFDVCLLLKNPKKQKTLKTTENTNKKAKLTPNLDTVNSLLYVCPDNSHFVLLIMMMSG